MTAKNPDALRATLSAAAESVRAANHQTLGGNGTPGLEFPSDVYDAIGNLKVLAERMPQLLHQLSLWLGEQNAAGKVGHDSRDDPGPFVARVRDALDTAELLSGDLAGALRAAQNESTGLCAARPVLRDI
jgi:hypothetical protein